MTGSGSIPAEHIIARIIRSENFSAQGWFLDARGTEFMDFEGSVEC